MNINNFFAKPALLPVNAQYSVASDRTITDILTE